MRFFASFVVVSFCFVVILAKNVPDPDFYDYISEEKDASENKDNETFNKDKSFIGDTRVNYIYSDELESEKTEYKITAFPNDVSTNHYCGVDVTSNNRIIGGEPTALNQYPWLAAIEFRVTDTRKTIVLCGGSLISGRYVVSAAHCFTDIKLSFPINVILGDYDITHDGRDCIGNVCSDKEVRIPIHKVIMHPQFDSSPEEDSPLFLHNDIALLRLAAWAPYTDAIRPICLPSIDLNLNIKKKLTLYVAGWGSIDKTNTSGIIDFEVIVDSPVKRHVAVPFVNQQQCQRIWTERGCVIMNQICAGQKEKDNCYGDSGGPLMYNNGGQFELSGIVSYGTEECKSENVPSVYTNVYRYKNWIINEINNREVEPEGEDPEPDY